MPAEGTDGFTPRERLRCSGGGDSWLKEQRTGEAVRIRWVCLIWFAVVGLAGSGAAVPPGAVQAAPQTTQQAAPDPKWLYIQSIGLSQGIVGVGLDANRTPIVPDHEIGWFNRSARPGEGGNIVLWGHVLRFRAHPEIPAPFENIKYVEPGDQIHMFTGDDQEHVYTVEEKFWAEPDDVEHILATEDERLTLVSCIGDYVIVDGSVEDMSHRLIIVARP